MDRASLVATTSCPLPTPCSSPFPNNKISRAKRSELADLVYCYWICSFVSWVVPPCACGALPRCTQPKGWFRGAEPCAMLGCWAIRLSVAALFECHRRNPGPRPQPNPIRPRKLRDSGPGGPRDHRHQIHLEKTYPQVAFSTLLFLCEAVSREIRDSPPESTALAPPFSGPSLGPLGLGGPRLRRSRQHGFVQPWGVQ